MFVFLKVGLVPTLIYQVDFGVVKNFGCWGFGDCLYRREFVEFGMIRVGLDRRIKALESWREVRKGTSNSLLKGSSIKFKF
jgi:hypothetical protein